MVGLRSEELIGRGRELARVRTAIAAAVDGRGLTLVLCGEPGVGKSRVRREAERLATERGFRVLAGHAVQRLSPVPYQPLAEALARGFAVDGPPQDNSLRPLLPTLAHVVPSWFSRTPAPPSVVGVAEAVLRLVETVGAASGALLVLEDLHWADEETLAVVEYVAENLADTRVLCLLTLRPEESAQTTRIVQRLADTRAAELVPVDPMPPPEVERLVLSCLRQDSVSERLLGFVADHADGVPFLVEELLAGLERSGTLVAGATGWQLAARWMAPSVPASLAASVADRYGALSAHTRDVLSAAALLGRRLDWRLLAGITGLSDDVVLASLREAVYAGLVVGGAVDFRFRHALTRDEVRRLTLPPQRVDLARRALAAVEQAHHEESAGWRDVAAGLAEAGDEPLRAVNHLLVAADEAEGRGALGGAAARLHRARVLAGGTTIVLDVDERLAVVRALAGDVDGAFTLGRSALARRRARRDDPGRESDLELALARAALVAGRYEDARAQARMAHDRAVGLPDPHRAAHARVLTAEIAVAAGDPVLAEHLATDILERAGEDLPTVLCAAHEVAGRCRRLHDVAAAEVAFTAARDVAERHQLMAWRARALQELGTIDLLDTLRTDRLIAARNAAVEVGAPAVEAVAEFHLAAALVSRGDAATGREAAERAVTLARRLRLAVLPAALAMLARSWAQERRRPEMEAVLGQLAEAAPGDPAAAAAGWSQARTMLALHQADRDAALAAQEQATELLRSAPAEHDPHRGLWALLCTLADDDGPSARAEAAAAPGSDTRFNRALLQAATAVAAGRHRDPGSATDEFDQALTMLGGYESADWMLHLTRWLVAPAALTHGWGDPIGWLDQAVRWFGGHGYDPLATSSRVLLRDAGGTVPRPGRGTATVPVHLSTVGVTSREVDVLLLVADGLTNRQIAERLVLSPRTVEKHVANLLLKTGQPDRTGLGQLTAQPGTPVAG